MAFEQYNSLNVVLTSAALSAAILHLLGTIGRREVQALQCATGLCLALNIATAWLGQGAVPVRALCLLTSFCMIGWLIWRVWSSRAGRARWHSVALIVGIAAVYGCGIHDLLLLGGWLAPHRPSYLFWGFFVLLAGITAMSGQYVVQTLNRAEHTNEELALHVARKSTELERSYALLRESEQEAARAHERGRLLRDMHDGLGAQLITALRGVERGALSPQALASALQDGLDELRLLMDSADMGYLPGALAAWRNRWDTRLGAAGVALNWHIDESLDSLQLSGEAALQVMRILQEAAANIVKHSQATQMVLDARVEAGSAGAQLCISISDNGVGMPHEAPRVGARGLKNMHYRAAEIGARLLIEAARPGIGTRVRLTLQLP